MSDASKKKQEAKNQAILMEMLSRPENRVCVECGEKGEEELP